MRTAPATTASNRRLTIHAHLTHTGEATTHQLAEALGYTEPEITRDLQHLVQAGWATTVHRTATTPLDRDTLDALPDGAVIQQADGVETAQKHGDYWYMPGSENPWLAVALLFALGPVVQIGRRP